VSVSPARAARSLSSKELSRLGEILSCLKSYSPDQFQDLAASGMLHWREQDGAIVSSLHCQPSESENGESTIEIVTLATAADSLKKGHAQALLREFLFSVAGKYSSVFLKVNRDNKAAIALYERTGFSLCPDRQETWLYLSSIPDEGRGNFQAVPFSIYLRFLMDNPQVMALSPWSRENLNRDIDGWLNCASVNGKEIRSVLDIGCGFGLHSLEMARRGLKVTALEQCPEFYKDVTDSLVTEGLYSLEFIYDRFPLELDRKFDLILVINNFVLWFDPDAAIPALLSHLETGGTVITDFPAHKPVFNVSRIGDFKLYPDGRVQNTLTGDSINIHSNSEIPYDDFLSQRGDQIRDALTSSGFSVTMGTHSIVARLC